MRLANILLKMNKMGSTVHKHKVTPAEVMFLTADHKVAAGGDPIVDLKELDGEVEITAAQERKRLAGRYGFKRVAKFFPGAIPQLPETFEEARLMGSSSSTATERLLTVGDTQ